GGTAAGGVNGETGAGALVCPPESELLAVLPPPPPPPHPTAARLVNATNKTLRSLSPAPVPHVLIGRPLYRHARPRSRACVNFQGRDVNVAGATIGPIDRCSLEHRELLLVQLALA